VKYKSILVAVSAALLFSGCFKNEPPKCSDPDVKSSVKKLYGDMKKKIYENPMSAIFTFFSGKKILPQKMVSLSNTRPIAYDENIKLRQCKADARFDNNESVTVIYTVQLSEENPDEYYVELSSDFLEPLMKKNLMQNALQTLEENTSIK